MGLVPVTSLMGNLYQPGQPNYAISRSGLGEARGTSSGGYDGRYGTILPWVGTQILQMAAWDPAMDAATLDKVRAQARAATDAYAQFISPLDDTQGTQTKFTLAQEDFVTYRDPYNPNANAGGFTVGPNYLLSDPTGGVSDPMARRAAYLEALYGITPGSGSGGNSQTQFLKNLGAYEASVRSLINVPPADSARPAGRAGAARSRLGGRADGSRSDLLSRRALLPERELAQRRHCRQGKRQPPGAHPRHHPPRRPGRAGLRAVQ